MTSDAQKAAGYLVPNPITGYPTICVSFLIPDALEYRGAVRGQLKALGDWWMWEKSYAPGDRRAAQVARIFEQLIAETLHFGNECFPDSSGCKEYSNTSYIIEWLPNHPHDQSGVPGYIFPPWYIAPPINLINATPGAAITDIVRFPYIPGQPPETLPRFRVHFSGTGVIELHLAGIEYGGDAIVQVDGDLLQIEIVRLDRNMIIEREITTPGAHFVDVTMIPVLQNDIPPVQFGGGLIKVVTCGFDDMAQSIEWRSVALDKQCDQLQWKFTTEDETAWRNVGTPICDGENGADGADGADGRTPELRVVPVDDLCKNVEWKYTDEGAESWRFLATICDGADGEDGAPGQDGADGQDGAPGADGVCPDCPPVETVPPEETDPETSGNNCAGAFGLVDTLLSILNYNIDQLEYAAELTYAVVNLVSLNIFEFLSKLPLVGAVFALLEATLSFGLAAVRSEINHPEFRETVVCLLYCAVEEEGEFNQTSYNAWMAAMHEEFDGILSGGQLFIDLVDNVIGYGAISRRYAIESLNDDARCVSLCGCAECSEEGMIHNFVQNPVVDDFGWSLVTEGGPGDWDCSESWSFSTASWSGSRITAGWRYTEPSEANLNNALGIQRNFGDGYTLCKANIVISNSTGNTNTRLSALWVKRKSSGAWENLVCKRIPFPTSGAATLAWEGDPIEITDMLVLCGVGQGNMTIARAELNYTP